MKALLKIEWIKTWRSWPVFIMGIGIPVGFFLLFSSIFSAPTPEAQKEFLLSYMASLCLVLVCLPFPICCKRTELNTG